MEERFKGLLRAIGAGLAITVGGCVYLSIENKIIGSLMFTIGLFAIILNELDLFTGQVGYLAIKKDKKDYIGTLIFTWLGNLFGTAIGAGLVCLTRINGISKKAGELCRIKLNDNLLSIFTLAIFCGMLMYIAVDGYRKKEQTILLFLCVSVFILCGFEHCIANMLFFTLAGTWSLKAIGYLLVMTLGNSVGGMIFPTIKAITGDKK